MVIFWKLTLSLLLRSMLSNVQTLIRKLPRPFTKRELLYAELCFEMECGRVIKPVQSYKSACSVDFPLWTVLKSISPDYPPIPYFNPQAFLVYNVEKKPPNTSPCFQSCHPNFFLTHTARMIYIKHLSEHIIALLTTQQWLSIFLRIKVSLLVGETETSRISPVPASLYSSLVFFTSDLPLQYTFSLTVVHWDTTQLISCLFALLMLFILPHAFA